MGNNEAVIKVQNLRKWFPVRRTIGQVLLRKPKLYVKAVDGIEFAIRPKEIFGLAGESGSGKTTTGKVVLGLYRPTTGKVLFRGIDIFSLRGKDLKILRRKLQLIFQDPYESLNPRIKIYDTLAEPLKIHHLVDSRDELDERIYKALEDVKLTPPDEFAERYPHELSGGQRQRVAIARALILNPEFIVADEPVSMLDVSIRAGVLRLLMELRDKYNVSMLYITHDLALAGIVTDRLAIMYLGKIVELAETTELLTDPMHPYAQALISAVPIPDPTLKRERIILKGEPPSPIFIPSGCRFWPRCPYAFDRCRKEEPELKEVKPGHYVACHLYDEKEGG